jgi:hypothetical protein
MAPETQKVVVTGQVIDDKNQPEPEMETYRLRSGARHFMDGEEVQSDDEVQLTQREFEAFADKFEPTGKKSTQRRSKPDKGVEEAPTLVADKLNPPPPIAAPTSHSPQDIGAKTIDLNAPKANPLNLTRGGSGVSTVAGGVPVSAASLQSAAEGPKEEQQAAQDGPVKSGIPPARDVVTATLAGGTTQPPQPEDKSGKK